MWELKAGGKSANIYMLLKREFHKKYVTQSAIDGSKPVKMRDGTHRGPGKQNVAPEGVSEQFRTVQKSLQVMQPLFGENVAVECGGEPGKSVYLKVSDS
jgi:hypothetical protein